MSRLRIVSILILAAAIPFVALGQTESEFYSQPKTAPEFWRAARFELRTGNFERAAERIKGLLDLNPDEKTLFDLVDKPGPGAEGGMAQFLKLRNVPRWNAKDTPDKEARKNVDELINRISKAVETELSNPERIRRYANALAGLPEEAAFALKELRRSGKSVPGVIAAMLGEELADDVRAAILAALPQLGAGTVPGFVAVLPAAPGQVQADLIDALRAREDYRALHANADTDPVPTLWYLWGKSATTDAVKKKARDGIAAATLSDPALERDPELRTPMGQLARIARLFAMDKGNLPELAGDAAYNVWTYDGKNLKETAMSRALANEHYGLRYARWALELQPDFAPAQKVFFTIALESNALHGGGGRPLATTAPDLHGALVTAPFQLLADLLEESMRDKKTAVVLAVVRVLGERTEAKAGRSEGRPGEKSASKDGRPSLLVKALDYPDPRVQFAAADALLRVPGAATHGRQAQIVKILAAAVAADQEEGSKQKALLTDPDAVRADALASVLHRAGFDVEVLRTGRQLMRRIQAKADADLIIVDRHVVDPMLIDLLPQLRADHRARTLPLMLVASGDGITPVNLLTALARLAAVVAFEDLPDSPYMPFPAVDGVQKKEIVEQAQFGFDEQRRHLLERHAAQIKKIQEVVEKAGFSLTEEMKYRIEYFSLQTFPHAFLDAFAPGLLTQEKIIVRLLLTDDARTELADAPVASQKSRIKTDRMPSREEAERIIRLMALTTTIEGELKADRLPAFMKLWDSFWNPESPKLPLMEPVHYPQLEDRLVRIAAPYKNIRVMPAVFTEVNFRDQLAQATDAKSPMLSPAEKSENAKTAMTWLRRMAVGELAGYRVSEAEAAMRGALRSNDLASLAIDALVRLPSKDVQLDLANLAVAGERPIPIRTQAAMALVEHIQTFGRFVTGPQSDAIAQAAAATEDTSLKARLLAAQGVLKSDAKVTGDQLKRLVPKPPIQPKVEPVKDKE